MVDSVEKGSGQTAKLEVGQKADAYMDEGFEVSDVPTCSETETAAAKGSKKYVDEDSKRSEYRSDEWRMKNFKAS